MNASVGVVIFGAKSPIVVEYEETLARCAIPLLAGISLGGPARMLDRAKVVPIELCARVPAGSAFLPCAFSPQARASLADHAVQAGFVLADALIDPHAIVARSCKVGAGSFLNAAAVIGAASRIGPMALINRSASVGHHCMIGRLVSIGPGANLASNVRVGDGAIIGAGAVILPDVRIGAGAVVAAGSVVRRSVVAQTVVSGHPARERRLRPTRTAILRGDQE